MGKTFSLLMAVALVWGCLEIYTEGMHGAFGGALASITGAEAPSEEDSLSTPKRAGRALERAHADRMGRFDKLDQPE